MIVAQLADAKGRFYVNVSRASFSSAAVLALLAACGGASKEMDKAPVAPGSLLIEPSRSIHLRAVFDDDPTAYVGRFIPDTLKSDQIDESSAAQTRCSEFFTTKVVSTSQEMDEIAYTSTKAAASLGVPMVGGASASHQADGKMRIHYTLTKRIQTTVKDPAALDRCCKGQPDQCTGKVIGEFLMGTGEVYQYAGKQDDVGANGTFKSVTGDISYKDAAAWKRVNSFKDTYFAFLTTPVSAGGGGSTASSDDSCSWCDNIPASLDGKFFCGVSPDVVSESMARDLAMRNAREQAVKFLGELLSTQSSTTASAVKGYLEDMQTVTAAASGLASQVKDQKWCKPDRTDSPNGKLYKSRVLAFFPTTDNATAARATLEAIIKTRKAAGKLGADEEKQIRGLMDNVK